MATKDWKKVKGKDEWKHRTNKSTIKITKLVLGYMVFTTSDIKNYPRNSKGLYYGNVFKTKKEALKQVKRIQKIN